MRLERVTDRDVALHGEGRDEQYGCVCGRLRGESCTTTKVRKGSIFGFRRILTAHYAEGLPKRVRIPLPELVHLLWQPKQEKKQIRDGQTEEVIVGRGVHVFILCNHRTRDRIADNSRDEDGRVDYRHGDHGGERVTDVTHLEGEKFFIGQVMTVVE